ncbi:MAG: hypothetical protein DCF22_14500 [Leptolyngbya sp.]|nr:MAG: hypothetical protein DCF22_14500 [Leptolyngbya sp.]
MNAPRQQAPKFEYVRELDNRFLALFPHRGDYLWAEHPDPRERPHWQTESRHLLSDRLIKQGAYLYGVRFGKETNYVMVEIDAGSPYHPGNDPQAINSMFAALEPLGLVQCVAIQSSDRTPSLLSDRRGIHFYFPFEEAQNSYQIAFAVKACLARTGFKVRDGWLEIFPHPRPYQKGKPSLYRGHRLPLQHASYLLNDDFEPIYTLETEFVAQWNHAQRRNDVDTATIEQVSREIIRKTQFPSTSAAKFNADLDAEIDLGFTGSGQTNYLLGRVIMKGYIFHHVLAGCIPLEGEALTTYAVETTQSLPGYQEFCGHQHEIEKRARDYTRAISTSRYYHYDPSKSKRSKSSLKLPSDGESTNAPTLNERRSMEAKQRIRNALADMLNKGTLPAQTTARKRAIAARGVSPRTLDKSRDLWHPEYLQSTSEIDHTPPIEIKNLESLELAQGKEGYTFKHNKLVPPFAAPLGQAKGHDLIGGYGGNSTGIDSTPLQVAQTVTSVPAQQEAVNFAKQQAIAAHMARMQLWLESGDPILVAEAQQVFTAQAQQSEDSPPLLVEIDLDQSAGCLLEDGIMPRGFGVAKQKQRVARKAPLKEVQQIDQRLRDSAIADAESAQVAVDFFQQQDPEEMALAWSIGVFNPLGEMEATHARELTSEEEAWLYVAQAIEWLLTEEDELYAIFFTAPPPDFALDQGDWYVYPELTTFLDEPTLLSTVVDQYPITLEILQAAINRRVDRLGWSPEQLEQFLQKLEFEVPQTQFSRDDWEVLLFELRIAEERQSVAE